MSVPLRSAGRSAGLCAQTKQRSTHGSSVNAIRRFAAASMLTSASTLRRSASLRPARTEYSSATSCAGMSSAAAPRSQRYSSSSLFSQHPTSRQFEVPPDAARQLRDEDTRVRALHRRSIKLACGVRSRSHCEHGSSDGQTRRSRGRSGDGQQRPRSSLPAHRWRGALIRRKESLSKLFCRWPNWSDSLVAVGSNCSTSFVVAFSMRFLGAVPASSPHRVSAPG